MSTSSAPKDGRGRVRLAPVRRPPRVHRVIALVASSTALIAAALSFGRAGLASRDDDHDRASAPAGEATDSAGHKPGSVPPTRTAFLRQQTLAAGAGPNVVVAADLDQDGDQDLVVTNVSGQEAFQVLRNSGTGAFAPSEPVLLPAIVDPGRFAVADLDRDGRLDLVLTGESSGNLAYLHNAGEGRLAHPAFRSLPSGTPAQAIAGDLDGDGWPEVVVTHLSASDELSIVAGGDAPWTDREISRLAVGRGIEAVALADLDQDGDLDLATANRETGVVSCFRNAGRGQFELATAVQAGRQPGSLAASDLNADGRPDLIAVNESSNDVSVFLAAGDLQFDPPAEYAVGDRPGLPLVADLDADSDLDLAVPGRFSDDVTVLTNSGDGRFTRTARWETDPGPTAIAALDLDGNALPDLAITSAIADCVTLWRNVTPPGAAPGTTEPAAAEITYELDAPARVSLVVFSSTGHAVRTLFDGFVPESGRHGVAWDGTNDAGDELPRGTYFYRVTTERSVELRRMTLF